MFVLVERVDVVPEMRALINTEHVAAALPASGGITTKLYLSTGEAWEIGLPFARAVSLLRDGEMPAGG